MARYIFITGGVVSSLGKGLMAASLAALLGAEGVGGALVGGASLTAEAFLPIVAAAGGEPVD